MWILASRGRPQNFQRFIDHWFLTKSSTPIYVRLDECDSTIEEYKKINVPKEFNVIIGPRARLGAAMAELYQNFPNEPWYGLLADDLIPRSNGWDVAMVAAADSKYISQANDLSPKPKNCCHPCIGGDLVRAAGFFGFPHTIHYCLEVVWKDLTKKERRFLKYLPDVVVENVHFDFAKAEFDKTYAEADAVKDSDHKIWDKWKETEFEPFYNKVKNILD